ncbi:MAG: hypothetical protein ACI8P3_000850 [Saprospiraceae bacterium]|jgi:uncharacterized protein YbaP (TraB family)
MTNKSRRYPQLELIRKFRYSVPKTEYHKKNTMYKFLFSICFLLFTENFSFAQVDVETTVVETKPDSLSYAPTKDENALLWEISGNGLEKPSYLYGTIHIISKEDFFLTDPTVASFNKSKKVVFEINMEEMSNPFMMLSLFKNLTMPEGVTLETLLSPEDYKFVHKKFGELGFPPFITGMFDKVKPLFLSAFASGDMDPQGMQNGDMVSYEMEFMEMAQNLELEMDGLETVEFQMSIFDSIPYEDQAAMLVESMKVDGEGMDELDIMVELYKNQDLIGMEKMFSAESGGLGEWDDILLNKRNENWIPIMKRMMPEMVTFFAVGAGHLVGENGVVALLRKQGYTLKPLREIRLNQSPKKD